MDEASLKRALRRLKKEELRMRFGEECLRRDGGLIWEAYFSFREGARVRYPFEALLRSGREGFQEAAAAFYAALCADFLRAEGQGGSYDQRLLAQMGLPPDAGEAEVKSRFRALAKELHPDCGGDGAAFIELMDIYRKLLGRE